MASVNSLRPTKLWWLVGLVLLCLSLLIQLPAAWLLQKFAPNNPYLQQISGNLWQGQANWQINARPNTPLAGSVDWRWQPWHLLMGKLGMAVDIRSGKTDLQGVVKFNKTSWQANDFNGKISHDTLAQLVSWQLPDTPITIKEVSIEKNKQGYQTAKGSMNWAGGDLGYSTGGKTYLIKLPTMQGNLSADKASVQPAANANGINNSNKAAQGKSLHLALTTPQAERLGDFYLDQDNMIDVSLTQRLLKNMPAYQGKGADDSVVVSIRQPLTSMGN
nr:type II secretion system protein N [Enhydrobacter aerosaccus]